jgi:hypothetical protein
MTPSELLLKADAEIQAAYARFTQMAQARFPSGQVSTRSSQNDREANHTWSMLESPAAEEIAVDIQVLLRGDQFWCELTLYVGQSSPVILAWSLWNEEQPLGQQVASVVRDLCSIAEPRIETLLRGWGGASSNRGRPT